MSTARMSAAAATAATRGQPRKAQWGRSSTTTSSPSVEKAAGEGHQGPPGVWLTSPDLAAIPPALRRTVPSAPVAFGRQVGRA